MKLRNFLSVVPKAVRRWSVVIFCCAILIGFGTGVYAVLQQGAGVATIFIDGGAGLAGGTFLAIWLLCLGFVYADARRRAMRPVLWVLVAFFFPHLLGFLLYFVLRQPIAATCTHCGQSIPVHQRFCSWCGSPQPVPTSGDVGVALGQS